jgi:hypothetical protein
MMVMLSSVGVGATGELQAHRVRTTGAQRVRSESALIRRTMLSA